MPTDIWLLTISLTGGLKPLTFRFDKPPSRRDFKQVSDRLPWLRAYESELKKLAANPWPHVASHCKAARVRHPDGVEVNVHREDLYMAGGYPRLYIPHDVINKFVNRRYKEPERLSAKSFISEHEDAVLEELVSLEGAGNVAFEYADYARLLKKLVTGGYAALGIPAFAKVEEAQPQA